MKLHYDKISRRSSKLITNAYSTSFSLGIKLFNKKYHEPIYSIYGFVRLADEIVDSFHAYNKEKLLDKFRDDTWEAIYEGISLNPLLNSFQEVVNKFNIDHELIEQFLNSMEMDLYLNEYDRNKFEEYVLGSAEVVGLMCLKVFVDADEKLYSELKTPAMKLGSAFQKINFLRDLRADYLNLGRSYFPNLDLSEFSKDDKFRIENEIEKDFKDGLEGIRKLPRGIRFGVYIAYVYYTQLFKKIKRTPPRCLMKKRVRVPNRQKYSLIFSSYMKHAFNLL